MKNLARLTAIALIALTGCRTTQATMPAELLVGTTWELAEINGKPVSVSSSDRPRAFINFSADNTVAGNSGCNTFGGSYNLNDEGGMNISQVMSTKMFCEGIDEQGFFGNLEKVTMSKAQKDRLVLYNGVDKVLVFVPKK